MIDHAQAVLRKHHPDLLPRIQFVRADGMRGYQNGAPYDAIYVEGAVRGDPRQRWIEQLRDGGVLFGAFYSTSEQSNAEVQLLRMMRKIEGSTFEQVDLMEVNFEDLDDVEPEVASRREPKRPSTLNHQSDFEEVPEDKAGEATQPKPFE